MFPWVYEFKWTAFHLIFLSVFFSIITIVLITVVKALLRTGKDFVTRRNEKVMWEATFEDLPKLARVCRHTMSGMLNDRVCPNGFDCRLCTKHDDVLAANTNSSSSRLLSGTVEKMFGFDLPLDRYYHRGHTWAKPEEDGTITIGIDNFGQRLAGLPDRVNLPPVGSVVEVNGTALNFVRNGKSARILSPVDGEVVAHGDWKQDWLLRIKPKSFDFKHLLRGNEVRPWMLREIERMEKLMSTSGVGETLADGGTLVDDIPGMMKPDVDLLWGEMFLQP